MFTKWKQGLMSLRAIGQQKANSKHSDDLFNSMIYLIRWQDDDGFKHTVKRSTWRQARAVKRIYKKYHPEIRQVVFDCGFVLTNRVVR